MFDKLDSELEVKMIDKLSPNTPAVTSCVEVFATEIKIESRDQSPF